jgi:hypothetical protein
VIDVPARATAGEKPRTDFATRWSAELESVRSMGSETASTRDTERDERSNPSSRNEVPLIMPVLTDTELAAARPANRQNMPEKFGALLAFAALLAFVVIGWTMFARVAVRRLGRRHLLDRSGKPRNPTARTDEARADFASAVTASRYSETAPESVRDPSSDLLPELQEIHRQLEELEPDPSSGRVQELEDIHRHLEELLWLLRGPKRTAA